MLRLARRSNLQPSRDATVMHMRAELEHRADHSLLLCTDLQESLCTDLQESHLKRLVHTHTHWYVIKLHTHITNVAAEHFTFGLQQ